MTAKKKKAPKKDYKETDPHGTPVTFFRCEHCGVEFSVCPAPSAESVANGCWRGCLHPKCESYEESRDVDKMIEDGTCCLAEDKRTLH
jgi:hypothetical protein